MAACVGALLVIATVLAFGVQDRLIWDDLELIGGLPSKTSAGSLMTVFGGDFFARGADAAELHYYRPIVQLTYLLGALFWNADPWAYGVSNLVFHLTACLLLFALLGRFGATPLAATLGTLVFGLMPRLTESVFWISGRTDVLASVFVLAALLACVIVVPWFILRRLRGMARIRAAGAGGVNFESSGRGTRESSVRESSVRGSSVRESSVVGDSEIG